MNKLEPLQAGELSCIFSLKAKRGSYAREELDKMTELEKRYLVKRSNTTVYYSVTDENGNEETYTTQQNTLGVFGTILFPMAALWGLAISGLGAAVPLLQYLTLFITSYARINKVSNNDYDDRLDFAITRETHDRIQQDLASRKIVPFHILFNNCARHGVTIAKRYGFNVQCRRLLTTPITLANYIKRCHEGQIATPAGGKAVMLSDRLESPARLWHAG